jgi:hypothetical protein
MVDWKKGAKKGAAGFATAGGSLVYDAAKRRRESKKAVGQLQSASLR